MTQPDLPNEPGLLIGDSGDLEAFIAELRQAKASLPSRIDADSGEGVEHGLAKLVLTVIELVRLLLEKQALRRVEAGSLSDEEIERLGRALLGLEAQMGELKQTFGFQDEDLNLDLGPLGTLL